MGEACIRGGKLDSNSMMWKRCQIKLFVVLDEKRRVSPRNGIISEGEILTNHLANIFVFLP